MAKNVSVPLNKKFITPEDKLLSDIDDMTIDITLIEPNSVNWGW